MSENTPARVFIETLGCARNDVDSSELTGRLANEGWELVESPDDADVALVNTCGFIEQAKKDSIDTVLELAGDAGDDGPSVVAIGCLAERYGEELAQELPEAAAVLGFDSYHDMSASLKKIVAGEKPAAHVPVDRRTLLPVSPVERNSSDVVLEPVARALNGNSWQPVKLASGCDRRCAFCAIPTFRGSFVSRTPQQVLHEATWLAEQGISELFLVSENTSSYGKDLGNIRLLESLLPQLAELDGIERVRVSYLQPAEIRPGLIEAIGETAGVAPYYDISFQHASASLLRRMRRFGSVDSFLELIRQVRSVNPEAGIRSNVIVGFPGETESEFADLMRFVDEAQLDVVGVFEYSDEDGTEAASMPDKVDPDVIKERAALVRQAAEVSMGDRAVARIGSTVRVLVEEHHDDGVVGRAAHQGPEVDGTTQILDVGPECVGTYVDALVVDAVGADLVAESSQQVDS